MTSLILFWKAHLYVIGLTLLMHQKLLGVYVGFQPTGLLRNRLGSDQGHSFENNAK